MSKERQKFCEVCANLRGGELGIYCERIDEDEGEGRQMRRAATDTVVFSTSEKIEDCQISQNTTEVTNEVYDQNLARLVWLIINNAGMNLFVERLVAGKDPLQTLESMLTEIEARSNNKRIARISKKSKTNSAERALLEKINPDLLDILSCIEENSSMAELFVQKSADVKTVNIGKFKHQGVHIQLQRWIEELVGQRYVFIIANQPLEKIQQDVSRLIRSSMFGPRNKTSSVDPFKLPNIYVTTSRNEAHLIASIVSQLCLLTKYKTKKSSSEEKLCTFWNTLSPELQKYLLSAFEPGKDPQSLPKPDPEFIEVLACKLGEYSFFTTSQPGKSKGRGAIQEPPNILDYKYTAGATNFIYPLIRSAHNQTELKPKR